MANQTVIIVPGIGGNELVVAGGFFQRVQVWLNYGALLAGGWKLLDTGATVQLTPGPALSAFYAPLFDRFQGRGYDVRSAVIDWREPVQRSGAALANQIRAAQTTVHLIGHSRGGLVMRAALANLAATGELLLVAKCVGIGVPHRGAMSAATLLGGFARSKLLVYALLAISQTLLRGGFPKRELNAVISTWPSTYELLPKPGAFPWSEHDENVCYTSGFWTDLGLPYRQDLATVARAQWDLLPEAPAGVDWLDIRGDGLLTPIHVVNTLRLDDAAGYSYVPNGDGIVPADAAVQAGHDRITFPQLDHQQLAQDTRVDQAIEEYFSTP